MGFLGRIKKFLTRTRPKRWQGFDFAGSFTAFTFTGTNKILPNRNGDVYTCGSPTVQVALTNNLDKESQESQEKLLNLAQTMGNPTSMGFSMSSASSGSPHHSSGPANLLANVGAFNGELVSDRINFQKHDKRTIMSAQVIGMCTISESQLWHNLSDPRKSPLFVLVLQERLGFEAPQIGPISRTILYDGDHWRSILGGKPKLLNQHDQEMIKKAVGDYVKKLD